MMSSRFGFIVAGCILALVLFAVSPMAREHESDAKGSEAKAHSAGEKYGEEKGKAEMGSEWAMQHDFMMEMAKVDNLLAEAKKAAEAGESKEAASKIAQAQGVIQERHKAVHKNMKKKMEHMEKAAGGEGSEGMKKASGWQCPMCAEHSGHAGSKSK